jgi:protein-disulfide isomerase
MAQLRGPLAALALLFAACEAPREPEPFTTVAITPFLGQPVMGNPSAPVEIVEYASTTCGHCLAFHEAVMPELKAKYIDTGRARLTFVIMPTPPANISLAGAAIARCAGEAKYFDVIAALFAKQSELIEAGRNPWRLQKHFRDIGAAHGLSADQVGTCIDDKSIDHATRRGVQDAPAFVTGTPTFLIGGEKIKPETLERLSAAIEAALAQAPRPPQ